MPSLQQLRYLVAVADALHFSRAADRMNVTQPTLSMQIKELETRLGVTLVERTRARVILTPMGAEIVRRARDVLSGVEDIRQLASQGEADALNSVLRLGVVDTVGAYLLSVVMPDLRAHFPNLRFHVREGRSHELLDALAEGKHDLVALAEEPMRPGFEAVHILREPWHVVLPSDHPLAQHKVITPKDLAGQVVLSTERGDTVDDRLVALCKEAGALLSRDFEGTSLDTIRQMVAVGMGITFLPALYVRSEVGRESAVLARPLSDAPPERDLMLVWRSATPRAAAYRELSGLLRRALAPYGVQDLRLPISQ